MADTRDDVTHRADEQFQSDEKQHQAYQKLREIAKKYAEAKQKETERRAAMKPAERLAEDEKRAAMTPEERAKDDESKGLAPEGFAEVNPLAGTPQFPIQTEGPHSAEFILSEGNGQISRAAGFLAGAVTIKPGQPLKQTVAPTSTTPATFVAAAAGADCNAVAIYGGVGDATNGLKIAVLVRNAEINGNLIQWGAITAPEQAIGLTTLAAAGIIARF